MAKAYVNMGFMISPGPVTFNNAVRPGNSKKIDLNHLMIEPIVLYLGSTL